MLQELVQCKSSRSKAFSAGLRTLEKKPGFLLLTDPFRVQTRSQGPLLLVHSLSLEGTGRRGAWERGCFVGGLIGRFTTVRFFSDASYGTSYFFLRFMPRV